MAILTIHGREYDSSTLHLVPAKNIKGEDCLQLCAYPNFGMDPHSLADVAYPSDAMQSADSLADAAHNALFALGNMQSILDYIVNSGTRAEFQSSIDCAAAPLRAALRAAGRIR